MAYNGHKNWTHWNVSLWLNNDEDLYSAMQLYMALARTKDDAAKMMRFWLINEANMDRTPDGAKYSVAAIRAAMWD